MSTTPERTTAAAFPRYVSARVVADSTTLRWPGLYVRRLQFPRVVDRFLVPATAEPLISCGVSGTAEFRERGHAGEPWSTRQIQPRDIFVTHSKSPYELRFSSPAGEELEVVQIHLAVDAFRTALEEAYPGKADEVAVLDFVGRDGALAGLCLTCCEMLTERTPGTARRVTALTELFASFLVEKYSVAAAERASVRGGLPIRQLRRVENYVSAHLAEEISLEALAAAVDLSPFHFSRMFKQTTGLSPLQYVSQERIARAQQMIYETPRSFIEIGLEVGYKNPSHFARVFRRMTGMTPTEFRNAF